MRRLLALLLLLCATMGAQAGVMTQAALSKAFPSPLIVGDKDAELPVWPIFKQEMTSTELVGYVFESIDFVSLPGFAGAPINLLVAIDPKGTFIDVQVISHHEPVFLEGYGPQPLFNFVSQYKGLSLTQNISIETGTRKNAKMDGNNVRIDGVSKATASVRIINQTLLSSSLAVARKKLGFAGGHDPDQIARVKPELLERHTPAELFGKHLVTHLSLTNRDVEQAFAGTDGEGLDAEGSAAPDGMFIDLYTALVSVPSIGRNLLDGPSWDKLQGRLEKGDHAILVMWGGRFSITPEEFTAGTSPERLTLQQGGLPIEMRDLDLELRLADGTPIAPDTMKVFRVIAQSGLDLAKPLEFFVNIKREKGVVYPEIIRAAMPYRLSLPERFYDVPAGDDKTFASIWRSRLPELAVLGAALLLLAGLLAQQRWLTANARRFTIIRIAFLSFTLGFIGWYAQGQLSVVNMTGLLQALNDGRSLSFFLYDPMTVSLWAFVAVTFFVWGRATFCGWLCPFGALQELVARLARVLRVPQLRLRTPLDARLKRIKYLLLAAIVLSALFAPRITDSLVEIEPFKTAITLVFVRSWPFVVYAVGLVLASAFVYKFFCRYLCPFGAGLAVLGKLRLSKWLPRRAECGTPCQTCRHRCDYQAIRRDGAIDYDECFQCMDCVVIYHSDTQCAPRILQARRGLTIPVRAVSAGEAA
ncbi:MAG: 4Fe-4S binding protein [Burkholderiaceae bacterium]|nr:4Fe-4S binding protein [Burkholderiaceae bacterium]